VHLVLAYCSKQRLFCHEFEPGPLIRGPVAGENLLKVVTERVSLYDTSKYMRAQAHSRVIIDTDQERYILWQSTKAGIQLTSSAHSKRSSNQLKRRTHNKNGSRAVF
jgi:hypothetical protein